MIALLAFATMFGAMVLTSLGNMAVALSMSFGQGAASSRAAFALSLVLALALSLVLGLGADVVLPSEGWLGWPVLAFGLYDLMRVWRAPVGDDGNRAVGGFLAVLGLFAVLSIDTVAVLAPLVAEGHGAYRVAAVLGGLSAVAIMSLTLAGLSTRLGPLLVGRRWLDFTGPVALVLAGIYILLDTPTDAV